VQYLEYVAELKARGVRLCVGSDCHSTRYAIDFETTAQMLDSIGLHDEDLWRLPPKGG
jgi:histidinol phosphatase-like PHP family hydrolase